MNVKNMVRVVLVTALLLMIPWVAIQFSGEVNWDLTDFAVMGGLLLGTGFTYELVASKVSNATQRAIFAALLLLIFLLIWAELAVGVFGTPFAGS
jgi:hypothetical protein